ncbi:MAG TPA: hypothetical protein VFE47_26160 [Tepidisphaeraceae bacterium]|jgi:hypothetical protein|nr:hypothetical protein [Tepidisphaeraceae bacterium]
MARTQSYRLNFLGVLALLIGIAAFVATKMPLAGYGPIPIALLGVGAGVLAFLLSLVLRWGSGVPVLAILLSLGALGLAEYKAGAMDQWIAKVHPAPAKPQLRATPAPAPAPAPSQNDSPHVHSIFDTDGGTPSAPSPSRTAPPATVTPPAPIPAAVAPAPVVPSIPQPVVPTVAEARDKLDAAKAAVEQSLSNDPTYVQAKGDVTAADAKRKAALAANEPGSAEVLEASNQWLAAQTALRKVVDAAAAKDANVQVAQRQMSAAEAAVRAGKSGK